MKYPSYIESTISFDEQSGLTDSLEPLERRYSDMKDMYLDEDARICLEREGNEIIYRFHDFHVPEKAGELAFGTSIVYPGKVGKEFHMTNGHYHCVLDTAEVYYCRRGHGLMLMESKDGDVLWKEIRKGEVVYVPGCYAHRSINLSNTEALITYFVFRADAGHDYGTIREKGFRNIVVDRNGSWEVLANPRY